MIQLFHKLKKKRLMNISFLQQSLQTTHASSVKPKECLKSKFIMNADVLYQLAVFGLADSSAKVKTPKMIERLLTFFAKRAIFRLWRTASR